MKAIIFKVTLILGIAAARMPMRKLNCNDTIAMCDRKGRRGNRNSSGKLCLLQNGEYKSYSYCESKIAVACNGATKVHFGKCGNCTKENICPRKMTQKKYTKVIKICTNSGETHNSMCDYMVERCNAAVEGRELSNKTMCQEKKCEILNRACANCEEEEETPSNFLANRKWNGKGRRLGMGMGKGKQHGKRFGKKHNKNKNKNRKGRMCGGKSKRQVCLLSNENEMKTTYIGKCGIKKDMICGRYEVFHNGTCGNCTEANICPLKAELENLRQKQESGINTARIQNKIRRLERRFVETDELCMCKWGIAKCQAMKSMEDIPSKESIPECQNDEDYEEGGEEEDSDEDEDKDNVDIQPPEPEDVKIL